MRRITGWIIGGFMIMALWVSGAGAQDGRQMYQGTRHNWREIHQDCGNIRRDDYRLWQDRRASNYESLVRDRAVLWHDRTHLRADRRALWHDWRHVYRDRYNRW